MKNLFRFLSSLFSNSKIAKKFDIAFYNSGLDKRAIGDYSGSIKDFTKAIEINPKDETSYYLRGQSKMDFKDYIGAISDFSKAIEIDPMNSSAYLMRGMARGEIRDSRGAEDMVKVLMLNKKPRGVGMCTAKRCEYTIGC